MPRRNLLGYCWDVVDINKPTFSTSSDSDQEDDQCRKKDSITATFELHSIYTQLINYTKETGVILLDECSLSDWIEFINPELLDPGLIP